MGIILLIFIGIPVVEIWLLIQVGGEIGAFSTIGLIFLTAVVGVAMIRWQGLATLMRANQRLQAGEAPALEMLEGMLLALAGVLLLIPGFATDALGFACLVPPVRRWLAGRWLARGAHLQARGFGGPGRGPDGRTFEGDYTRDESKPERKHLP